MRLALLTGFAVLAMAFGVLYASDVQSTTANRHAVQAELARQILSDVNRSDAALASYSLTGDSEMLDDQRVASADLRLALDALARGSEGDADVAGAAAIQRRLIQRFETNAASDLAGSEAEQRAALRERAQARHTTVDRIADANAALRARQAELADREDTRAGYTAPIIIVVLSLLFGTAATLALRRARRDEHRRARFRSAQERFGEAMQVTNTQTEAHGLLKSHLERSMPGTSITVLNRNNSADRLEASTPIPEDSPLSASLLQARPRSCMAVRLSRPFADGEGTEEVLSCEVCGVLASDTTCQPLLVGGEVIGSVLVEHDGGVLAGELEERVTQSVAQSAPVLANLRNLAIAETRAATDALTGLPNRRAVDDTLLRMLAQAGRSFDPLSAIMLDLDHFKVINDTYGHDRGDEVLAAFATRLRELMRASDFAGRSGGEEFIIFLPDTDRTGAVRLAEKVRESMRSLTVPGVDRPITASFGIACFPDDAVEAEALMRSADRALYAAKRGGRDRIEASSTGSPVDAARERPAAELNGAAPAEPTGAAPVEPNGAPMAGESRR